FSNRPRDPLRFAAEAFTTSRQAAQKRKRAQQLVANAQALEASATKTRGPSLRALVDSGDLNLYGDAEGKVYLRGKPGVVIAGLKPGAAVDATTPAATHQTPQTADQRTEATAPAGPNASSEAGAADAARGEAAQVVELADQIVSEGAGDGATLPLLLALFLTRPSGSPKAPAPSNPAELFDAFAYPGR